MELDWHIGLVKLNKAKCLYSRFQRKQVLGTHKKVSPGLRITEKADKDTVRV